MSCTQNTREQEKPLMAYPLFTLHDTHGYPIDDIARDLADRGLYIDWTRWMISAIEAGWTYDKIAKTIYRVNDEIFGGVWRRYIELIPRIYLDLTQNMPMD